MSARQFFLCLILTSYSLILPTAASANSIYNRSPWPAAYQGLDAEKDNTDYQDAIHPCNRTHGRSFSVTHTDGFKLSGLSVYIYVPNSQAGKFDRNLFRLSFLDSSYKLLVTNTSPTYSAAIWMDGGGLTSEVFFPINININGGVAYTAILECFTDEPDTFRVPESSRIDDGLTQYYDSTTSQTNPYYMSGRKVLFTTFSERNSPHFPALSSVIGQVSSVPPKYHPVIFVHGLGGDPTNFESDAENRNYVKLLTDLGYPRDYIHLYSYGYKYDPIKRVNYYNYQGDVREIAQGMEVAVNTLSDLNKSQGGDGQVDIVAHSLGNLVTRQYLLTHKDNHKIRRYIAVGAPFKGAWFMSADKNIKSIPLAGSPIENAIANFFLDNYNKGKTIKVTKDSAASIQATPGSEFLEGSNGINRTKIDNLEVYAIYGDVNTTIRQKVFNKSFERKFNLGDGLILSDSATYTAWTDFNSRKFAYSGAIILDVKFDRLKGALAAEISSNDLTAVKSLHSDLLTRSDSKGKISCLISENDVSKCYN